MTVFTSAKVFFDTQICINAASGRITETDWHEAIGHILTSEEYWISPLTLGEIILSIAKGDEKYFEIGKTRLRTIYCNGRGKFFDFPRYFIAGTLGLRDRRPLNLEDDFGFSIQVILLADSKRNLAEGVALPHLKQTRAKVRIDRFLSEIEANQQHYVELFSTRKGSSKNKLTPEQWAMPALRLYGIHDDEAARSRFIESLSAAYQFDVALLDLARNRNYDLRKNVSDLVDTQQLCYLCDPTVVFVTDDSDHRHRLLGNAQSNRVLTFREVLTRIRGKKPLLPTN
jgi:hypothetical protein